MQRDLEEALDRVDDIIESVQQQPPPGRPSADKEKSLHEKLYDIYVEECEKEPEVEGLRSSVNLLEKLVKRESLPCLVVNLFPENQDYSLMLKDKNGSFSDTFKVPCTIEKLLDYLDAEELPPFLLSALEKSPVNVFQQGCVIAEIRDYRQCSKTEPPGYQTRHILLCPTMQTLMCDVESMTNDGRHWTQEEKLELESQLILATAEPLCLDPSVQVTFMTNRLLYNEKKMLKESLRQGFKKHTCPSLDQLNLPSPCPTPPDFTRMTASKTQAQIKPDDPFDPKPDEAGECVDTWKQRPCELAVPSEVDVQKNSEGELSVPCDESEPTFWPDAEVNCNSLFDWKSGCQPWAIRQSIMQSLNDPLLSAEVGLPTESVCTDSQMYLRDCSGDFMGGAKTEFGKVEDVFQGSVQSEAECPGKMPQRSSGPECLSQPCPEKKARSSLVPPSGMEMEAKPPAPAATVPSSSGQGVSASNHPSLQAARGRKCPLLTVHPKAASVTLQPFVKVRRPCPLPPGGHPPARLPENRPKIQDPSSTTDLNVTSKPKAMPRASSLVSGSSQVLGPTGVLAPEAIPVSRILPSPDQLPDAQPVPAQCPVQASMQFIVNNTSNPVTVKIPPGSILLCPASHPRLQSQPQPQSRLQLPQQQKELFVMIPKQHQPPRASLPPQPMPLAPIQGSSIQQWALPAQHTGLNLAVAMELQQSQAPVLSQVDSAQQSHGQGLPSQSLSRSASLTQQPEAPIQNVQLRLMGHTVPTTTLSTRYHQPRHTGSQPSDRDRGSPSSKQKS